MISKEINNIARRLADTKSLGELIQVFKIEHSGFTMRVGSMMPEPAREAFYMSRSLEAMIMDTGMKHEQVKVITGFLDHLTLFKEILR